MKIGKYYSTKQTRQPVNFSIALGLSAVWTLATSSLYGIIVAISPAIYFNFIACIGFSVLLGFSIQTIAKVAKLIDRNSAVKLGVFSGILAYYSQWIAYLLFMQENITGTERIEYFFTMFINPAFVFSSITEVFTIGMRELSHFSFSKLIYGLVLVIEAGIILQVPFIMVQNQAIVPFSTKYNKWYKKYVFKNNIKGIVNSKEFCSGLKPNTYDFIKNVEKSQAGTNSIISIFFLEGENQQYISANNLQENNNQDAINLLPISSEEASSIIKSYNAKKVVSL